jgi:tellurite resistance protein
VGFLAWTALAGGLDPFGRILINGAYLFVLIVAVQMPAILRLPFALSFWALSFPVAAVTIASFRYADLAASPVHQLIGLVLLVILCLTLAALLLRTWRAVRSGAVFQPD